MATRSQPDAPGGGQPGKQTRRQVDLDTALADRQAPRYSTGQAAELLGLPQWFLRRLDSLDVVKPSRNGGAQRRYSGDQLRQVAEARALMDDGVSASAVRRVLELEARVERLEAELARARTGAQGHPGGDRAGNPPPGGRD